MCLIFWVWDYILRQNIIYIYRPSGSLSMYISKYTCNNSYIYIYNSYIYNHQKYRKVKKITTFFAKSCTTNFDLFGKFLRRAEKSKKAPWPTRPWRWPAFPGGRPQATHPGDRSRRWDGVRIDVRRWGGELIL